MVLHTHGWTVLKPMTLVTCHMLVIFHVFELRSFCCSYKELDCRNPSKQLLALKLLETCMKNSSPQLATLVAQKKMMNLMAEHATGKKNSGTNQSHHLVYLALPL